MDIAILAIIFYIVLVLLGLITVWLSFPGTMLVLGGAVIYDLFVRGNNLPWQAYLVMFTLLAVGEIADVVLTAYWKKSPKVSSVVRTIMCIAMIIVFVMTL